jgi:hypothetical protein
MNFGPRLEEEKGSRADFSQKAVNRLLTPFLLWPLALSIPPDQVSIVVFVAGGSYQGSPYSSMRR